MVGRILSMAAIVLVAGIIGVAAGSGVNPSVAQASQNCSTPQYPGSGYFTSLRVSATSCSRGRAVTLAHYRCRTKSGKAGKCSARVSGYRCSEKRTSISTEINAIVTCRKGKAQVRYSYQQNT